MKRLLSSSVVFFSLLFVLASFQTAEARHSSRSRVQVNLGTQVNVGTVVRPYDSYIVHRPQPVYVGRPVPVPVPSYPQEQVVVYTAPQPCYEKVIVYPSVPFFSGVSFNWFWR